MMPTTNDPIFLTANRLNRHVDLGEDLVVTTGSTLKHRLYDMDPRSRWQSVGSSDLITEVITAGLWLPGMQSAFDIELIAILNHNLKSIVVEGSADNGLTYSNILTDADLDEETNTLINLESSLNKIRVSSLLTETANEEKKIGGIIVAGDLFQPGPFFKYDVEAPRISHKSAVMADGSIRGAPLYRSDASAHFWSAKVSFMLNDDDEEYESDRERFRQMALLMETFIIIPQPLDFPGEMYQCRIRPGTYNDNFITRSKSGGRAVQMVIEEVGGA